MKTCYLVIINAVLVASCQPKEFEPDSALLQMVLREKELVCKLQNMRDSITQAWDSVNMVLSTELPVDMPETEKSNMLAVRNAELIKMFQTYEALGTNVKSRIERIERLDKEIAARIGKIRNEIEHIEAGKLKRLHQIKRDKGDQEINKYKEMGDSILVAPCHL